MAQETIVFILGVVLFVTPFLGIPADWKLYIYVGAAGLLMVIGYRLRYARFVRTLESTNSDETTGAYAETGPKGASTTSNKSVSV